MSNLLNGTYFTAFALHEIGGGGGGGGGGGWNIELINWRDTCNSVQFIFSMVFHISSLAYLMTPIIEEAF